MATASAQSYPEADLRHQREHPARDHSSGQRACRRRGDRQPTRCERHVQPLGLGQLNLTSLTERTDNTVTAGNGGSLGIATGLKSSAGAYGTTAATHASSAVKGMISIAIKKYPRTQPNRGGAQPNPTARGPKAAVFSRPISTRSAPSNVLTPTKDAEPSLMLAPR